jgi:hypothetical protein
LEVKISAWGPPTTPTLNVPVIPDVDISTPFSEPVVLNGMMAWADGCLPYRMLTATMLARADEVIE